MSAHIRALLGAAMLALAPLVAFAQAPAPAAPPATEQPPAQSQPAVTPPAVAAPAAQDATGEKGSGRGRPMAACRQDVDTLCPGKVKGERRRCLEENAAKLSPACTAAREKVSGLAKEMRKSCRGDVQALCADAAKGKGGEGIMACLTANTAKLSPDCGKAFEARVKAE